MRRIYFLIVPFFVISLVLAHAFSVEGATEIGTGSENDSTNLINNLLKSHRITSPRKVLKDFIENRSTSIRVIVNLREPETIDAQNSLKQPNERERVANRVHALLEQVLRTFNPKQIRTTRRFKYMAGFSAQVTLDGLEALSGDDDVLSIEKDRLVYPNLAQGIPLMNASAVRGLYNGNGVSVAICDTGVDYNHNDLGGGGFPNSKVIGGYDVGDNDGDPMDSQGHGTACAGIVAGRLATTGDYIGGVAYNAKLYAVKISRGSGSGAYDSDLIRGWEWCITHQYDDPNNPILVINTSFGGGRYFSYCDGVASAYDTAAQNVVSAGISLFVSAGNEGYCDSLSSPACISSVISVGAVYDADLGRNPPEGWVGCIANGSCVGTPGPPCDEKYYADEPANANQVATYSNSASFLNILAPANWATTTLLGGGYWDTPNGFGGTSAAAPYAAGAAAALQSAAVAVTGSFLTPAQVKSILADTGDLLSDGKAAITKPRVNLGKAVASLGAAGTAVYVEPSGSCGGNTPCYDGIQDAIDAAGSGDTIKISRDALSQAITLNVSKTLTLQGGWNPEFTARTSITTITSLTILKGSVGVEHLVME